MALLKKPFVYPHKKSLFSRSSVPQTSPSFVKQSKKDILKLVCRTADIDITLEPVITKIVGTAGHLQTLGMVS